MKIPDIQNQVSILSKEKTQTIKNETKDKDPKLEQSAKELEALFLSYVLKSMEKTISIESDGKSNNLAKMMFSSVMGKEIAENGGIGLADFIYKSLAETGENPLDAIRKEHNTNYLNIINNLRSSDD